MCSTKQRLAAVLREQRTDRGLTLRQAAERAKIAPSTLSRWEAGTCLPRVPELEALLSALGVDRTNVTRILVSLDAPRAARAVRKSQSEGLGEVIAPSGGAILKALRRKSGYTLHEIADRLGVAPSTVSRWETSSAHPSPEALEGLFDLLGATAAERACLGSSGVGKIKSDRLEFDRLRYEVEIEGIESRLAVGPSEGVELRLLQLQSALWWSLDEAGAADLLRHVYVIYAEFLATAERYSESAHEAQKSLEMEKGNFDALSVRAYRVIARSDVFRGVTLRPHLGLYTLQRCLRQSEGDEVRSPLLADMSEFSILAGRSHEAEDYGTRSLQCAERIQDVETITRAKRLLAQIASSKLD